MTLKIGFSATKKTKYILLKFVIISCTIAYFIRTTVKCVDKGVPRTKKNNDEIGQQKKETCLRTWLTAAKTVLNNYFKVRENGRSILVTTAWNNLTNSRYKKVCMVMMKLVKKTCLRTGLTAAKTRRWAHADPSAQIILTSANALWRKLEARAVAIASPWFP